MILKILIITTTLFSLLSCSTILEERDECPCILDFNFEDKKIDYLHLWLFEENNNLLFKTSFYVNKKTSLSIEIPRGYYNCVLWGNINKNTLLKSNNTGNDVILTKDNFPADSLYYFSSKIVSYKKEKLDLPVTLCKEHIIIDLLLIHPLSKDTFKAKTSYLNKGYYTTTKEIIHGKTNTISLPKRISGDSTIYNYTILRPISLSNLYIEIEKEDYTIYSLDLGQILITNGYNINKKNLDDLYLEINLIDNYINISTSNWKYHKEVSIEFT